MTVDEIIAEVSAAGYFPFFRKWGNESGVESVRTRSPGGQYYSPLIKTIQDESGRWYLTVFGEECYYIPEEGAVPAVTIEMLRAMDNCMRFSEEIIAKYRLERIEHDDE
jgi:hypothetical protein